MKHSVETLANISELKLISSPAFAGANREASTLSANTIHVRSCFHSLVQAHRYPGATGASLPSEEQGFHDLVGNSKTMSTGSIGLPHSDFLVDSTALHSSLCELNTWSYTYPL